MKLPKYVSLVSQSSIKVFNGQQRLSISLIPLSEVGLFERVVFSSVYGKQQIIPAGYMSRDQLDLK